VEALQQVLALQAQTILPGHGPIATAVDVQLQIDHWHWLQDTLQVFAKAGHSAMDAAQACLQTSTFKRSAFAAWLAPERIYTSTCTIYREWGLETPALPGPLGALDHFRRQASLTL
jgi:cyclase